MADDEANKDAPETRTLDEVTMDKGNVEFHDLVGIVSGNVYRGGVIRGNSDLTVEGEVLGVAQTRCLIEMGGDIEIEQAATGARMTARNITIHGDVESCSLTVEENVEIHGNVTDSDIVVGTSSTALKRLNQLKLEQKSADQKVKELQVQVSSQGRKFIRDYPQVDLKMGNILVPGTRELRVNLDQFYSAMDSTDEAKINRALEEFYLRVVVGMLTRNNKHYISRNPNRHKVFLRLIEDLREHVFRVRELDVTKEKVKSSGSDAAALLQKLQDPEEPHKLRIGGGITEGVAVHFVVLDEFQEKPSGTYDVQKSVFECEVIAAEAGNGIALQVKNGQGEESVVEGDANGFVNGALVADFGTVVWQAGG